MWTTTCNTPSPTGELLLSRFVVSVTFETTRLWTLEPEAHPCTLFFTTQGRALLFLMLPAGTHAVPHWPAAVLSAFLLRARINCHDNSGLSPKTKSYPEW